MLDLKGYKLILASQSPRRRELLKGLDVEFSTCTVDADESFPAELKGADAVQYICKAKANAYKPQLAENTITITADTVVILDDNIIGKPKSKEEAFAMIRSLSGRVHEVITAVCIFSREKESCFYSSTEVHFSCLTDEEINYYIEKSVKHYAQNLVLIVSGQCLCKSYLDQKNGMLYIKANHILMVVT